MVDVELSDYDILDAKYRKMNAMYDELLRVSMYDLSSKSRQIIIGLRQKTKELEEEIEHSRIIHKKHKDKFNALLAENTTFRNELKTLKKNIIE